MYIHIQVPMWSEEEAGVSEAVVTGACWVLGIKLGSSERAVTSLNS